VSELLEQFTVLLPHEPDKCPFCPIQENYSSPDAVVSDGNNSTTLAGNLNTHADVDGTDAGHILDIMQSTGGVHGVYTVTAHHLVCGNEILGKQKEIQSFLCKEGRHDGKLQPCDTGYDVNNAKNGIWLPTTPDRYKAKFGAAALKRELAVAEANGALDEDISQAEMLQFFRANYGRETRVLGITNWTNLSDEDQDKIAFAVMLKKERQFHLGEHEGAVPQQDRAEHSYVVQGIKHLDTLTVYMRHYADRCPMENGQPINKQPYKPPFKLNGYLDIVSEQLRRYVTGNPRNWRYFISKWAYRLWRALQNAPAV
jgi:A nuclease family of the HNH/ENDO VII superfamily with conserved AHH